MLALGGMALGMILPSAAATVSLRPWGADAVRLQFCAGACSDLLPGALGSAAPSASGSASSAAATTATATTVTSGNLACVVDGEGSAARVTCRRVDDGKVLLRQTNLTLPTLPGGPPPVGPPPPPPPRVPVPANICTNVDASTDQVGGTVIGSIKDQTDAECCAACVKNPACGAWVTGKKHTPVGPNGCFLISGATGKVGKSDRTAGFVRNDTKGGGGGGLGGSVSFDFSPSAQHVFGMGQTSQCRHWRSAPPLALTPPLVLTSYHRSDGNVSRIFNSPPSLRARVTLV